MTDPLSSDPKPRITVDRAALKALRATLYRERGSRDALQKQLNRETEFSRRAAEETLAARDDRDGFRRVMAVGLANEQNAVGALSAERARVERLEQALAESRREQGQALGRAQEIEARIAVMQEEHAAALKTCDARLHDQAQRAHAEAARLTREVGHAQGVADELRALIPPVEDDTQRVARARARACLAAAALCGIVSLILMPAVLMSLFSGERPEYLRLAIGMPPGFLLLSETLFLAAAFLLSTHGLREIRRLKGDEPRSEP